jgi:DNA polymerase-1
MMDKIYVIDASGYLYRSYFAIRNMTNDKGESTNALYGFIRSVLKLIKDFEPKYLVSVFDGPGGKGPREAIYADYKLHRKEMPADLRYQIQWAQEFCDLIGFPKLVITGVEADDTMGSIAKWAGSEGSQVYLCTSDKDLAQMVDDHVFLLNTHKENLLLDKEKVEEVYGVNPKQIIDLLSITGDASDNIPGLPGFGAKTAIALLKEFGSLDEILKNPEKVPGKKKQDTLIQEGDKAILSRQLVTINTDVDFPKEADFFLIKQPDRDNLNKFYTKMNFNSLIKEMGGATVHELEITSYQLVDDEESFQKLLAHLAIQKEICFTTEASSPNPISAELVGIGFCTEEKTGWYVPVNGHLGLDQVQKGLRPLFENPQIGFFGQNVKYDYNLLAKFNIVVKKITFDTMLASYVLEAQSRQHSLEHLILTRFGKVKTPISMLIGSGKNILTVQEAPILQVSQYCCEEVDYTFRLKQIFEKELKERKLDKVFFNIELPLLPVLARMERHGIYLDLTVLEKVSVKVLQEIDLLEKEIHLLAGENFNINSPKQLSEILFTKMGITATKKIASGHSTNAEVLEELSADNPIAKKVLEYRTVEKLRSTYIESLPAEINPKDNRIHPTFNQVVAATGRLSCHDPNLQNIPVRSELGKEIREAFRPEKQGWSYLAADYSQIELRLVAHLSEDPNMLEAFQNNEDIHTYTAATILGIPIGEVTKLQRFHAKAVNFGIIYGQQAYGLSRELGISMEEASNFIKKYFERYKKVQEFVEYCKEKSRKTGKAVTVTGRERALPEINSKNGQIRAAAERLAVNTPLQGTAADLIKLAMLKIDERVEKEKKIGYMILQVHDELIFEIPDFEIIDFKSIVKQNMESVFKLKVPLVVDISVGKNWKEC